MKEEEDKLAQELAELYNYEEEIEEDNLFNQIKQIPAAFERYDNMEFIAKGGMKEIFKVFDPKTGRNVALARLLQNSPEELHETFLREARLTAMLDHPNIITVHEIGIDLDEKPYFTMEFKVGHNLREIITCPLLSKEFLQQDLIEIFIKICNAISYAHSLDILHLDLKPDNIQVGDYGEVIVCDWGLGKKIGDCNLDGGELDQLLLNQDLLYNMTLAGKIKGTPGYMAPEQINAKQPKSPQTDIYALGCLLFTLLCKKPPVQGNQEEIMHKTNTGDILPSIQQISTTKLPSGLRAIILKAMALNPSDRYASVHEMKSDVRNYLSGYTVSVEESNAIKEAKLFYKRNRSQCQIAATFILVTFLLTTIFFFRLNQSRLIAKQERNTAEEQKILAEANLDKYLKEKERTNLLNVERAKALENDTHPMRFHYFFTDPVKNLQETIKRMQFVYELNPSNRKALAIIGSTYFTMQNFKKANELYEKCSEGEEDLFLLSQEFENRPKDPEGLLSLEHFIELIEKTGSNGFRNYLCERMIAFHTLNSWKKHKDYAPLVETLIRAWAIKGKRNPQPIQFNYDPITETLQLKGKEIVYIESDSIHGSGKSLLRYIPIKHLNISSTSVYKLSSIPNLSHLKTINLRETQTSNLWPIAKLPLIESIEISPEQYSEKMLSNFPKSIKLIKDP
jgi:serine/threonine protein kinase